MPIGSSCCITVRSASREVIRNCLRSEVSIGNSTNSSTPILPSLSWLQILLTFSRRSVWHRHEAVERFVNLQIHLRLAWDQPAPIIASAFQITGQLRGV